MRSKQKIATCVVLAILILPVVYLGRQLVLILNPPYQTETAIEYDMSDSVQCQGYLLFEQTQVPGDGLLGYLVANGERVSAGSVVAEVYTDASQSRARQALTRLDDRLELLKVSENTVGSDVDLLLAQRQTALYNLLDELDQQSYDVADKLAANYLLAVNRLQITTGVVDGFSGPREQLAEERQLLLQQLGSPPPVTAPAGGYFISANKSDLLLYDSAQLEAMSPQELAEVLEQEAGVAAIEGAGKLVNSYKWYFYGVCTLQQSAKFEASTKVNISFPGKAEKTLPAKVVQVLPDQASGLAKVVLSCEYVGADVLSLTRATAQIDFESFKGIRVNGKALHIVNGDKGVYVKYGNLARFRKIEILYQNEDYILVPEGGKVGTDNEVRLFDEIIVQGTELKDGKLLS